MTENVTVSRRYALSLAARVIWRKAHHIGVAFG
jgi:hypothetical protein